MNVINKHGACLILHSQSINTTERLQRRIYSTYSLQMKKKN